MNFWLDPLPVISMSALFQSKCYRSGASGFTLIEILVALTIFAVTASALIGSMTNHIAQSTALREKTIAHWIAVNEMNQLRLPEKAAEIESKKRIAERYPDLGTNYKQVTMADRKWEVEIDVTSTENKDIRRITVKVSKADRGNNVAVFDLAGFMGRY